MQPTGTVPFPDRDAPEVVFICPTCAASTLGDYCGACGEKRIGLHDYSLKHYLKDAAATFTSLDTKIFRSVWFLLSKPGFLSAEHFRGRRSKYVKPLQLFVFLNVIYYFSLTLFVATTFTTPLATQLRMNNYYPGYAQRQVERKMQRDAINYQSLESRYNGRTGILSKTLIFLLIPFFAAVLYALFFKKRKYFVEHVVVATHFWSFNLILLGVVLPIVSVLMIRLFRSLNISSYYVMSDNISSVALQLCIGVYLFVMLRRAYVASTWYCVVAASVIAWSFFHIVWLYRFCLFELTLRSL